MTKTFGTMKDAEKYIETALGEFANDYDIETMANEQTEWQGEGWYSIGYSDGGQDWTSNGAIWIESKQQLEDELAAAREDETDTHLVCCEYLGDNDEPNEVQ